MRRRAFDAPATIVAVTLAIPAVAQQVTFLDATHQGQGNKGVMFRPVDSTGNPAFFVLTALSGVNAAAPTDPDSAGSIGTIHVDRDDNGTGVQSSGGGGSKAISGGGPDQDEELTFMFDAAVPAASILLDLVAINFGNGPDAGDDPVIFLFSSGNMGVYDHTILEADIQSAFTPTGNDRGRVDFSQFGSIPPDLLIHAFKLRETRGHVAVARIGNPQTDLCQPVPSGKVAVCHIPPGNPSNAHTIVVSENAVPAHLAHGDFLGHCQPCPGACCLSAGGCEQLLEVNCDAVGGEFLGEGVDCADCPVLTGACCFSDGAGCTEVSQSDCDALAGDFRGHSTQCATECPDVERACCLATGSCLLLTESACMAQGGTFLADQTSCQAETCLGACCFEGGFPCVEMSEESCGVLGGDFRGPGTLCVVECPEVQRACCFADGGCQVLSEVACTEQGGAFLPDRAECASDACVGACCLGAGACAEISQISCSVLKGEFLGIGVDCSECPPATGACCDAADDSCSITEEAECSGPGLSYQGDGTTCSPNPCTAPRGACCFADGTCSEIAESSCKQSGGKFLGRDTDCADCPPPTGACCDAADGSCVEGSEGSCMGPNLTYQGMARPAL